MTRLSLNTEAFDTDKRDRRTESTISEDNSLLGILNRIPQLPQRQDSTNDQLNDLRMFANKLGMYDAENILENLTNGTR